MLQVLREKASSWIIKILLGFLVVAFAIWGINDVFLGERDPAVAKVGGVKITRSNFEESYRDELNRLRQVLGNIDRETAQRMGIDRQVLDRIVNRTALNLAARDLGIVTSDHMVNKQIRSDPRFQDEKGVFDRNRFYQSLRAANVAESYFVATLKESLATDHLVQAVTANIPVPKALIDPMTRFRSEERVAKTVLVPPPPLGQAEEPKEEDVAAYYKANTQRFMAPEYREVTFVHLDPAELAKEITIPEERIKESYPQRLDEFTLRDRRKVKQVVFRTEAAATAAAALIKAGKSLAEAAKENGKPVKVVNLDWVEKSDLLTDIAGPVFALKKGEISAVLKSPLGWHIVQVEDAQQGRVKPLEEVREQVRNALAVTEAQNNIFSLANQLEDALAGGADIRSAAARINVKAHHIPALDRQGRGKDEKPIAEIPKGGNFLAVAFETEEGQNSALTETRAGGFFLLTVNKVTPPKAKPLKEVRSTAVMSWKAEQQAAKAEKRAKAILEKIRKGTPIETVAKEEKLEVKTTPPFTRLTHEAQTGVPAALAEKLFSFKPGEADMAESAKGFVVGVLVSANPTGGKDRAEIEKGTLEEVKDGISADLTDQLIDAFRGRFTIKTYPDLLKERL